MNRKEFIAVISTMLIFGQCLNLARAEGSLQTGPVVYEDRNITVRSSVINIESETFHLGQVISVVIGLDYQPSRVRTVNFDGTLLAGSWDQLEWISLVDGPRLSKRTVSDNYTSVEAIYDFQLLGCPEVVTPCPGGKLYQLPDISLYLELIDDNQRVVSTDQVIFRPWPGSIAVTSALPLIGGKLAPFQFYFPRRAFGLPVSVEANPYPMLIIFFVGFLTIGGMAFAPVARIWVRHRFPSRISILDSRWEMVLDRLREDNIKDDEFWEGVRVAITSYCHDLYNLNTVHWAMESADNSSQTESNDEEIVNLKKLYLNATYGRILDDDLRSEILSNLATIFDRK